MTLDSLFVFLAISIAFGLKPGPGTTLIVAKTISEGKPSAIYFIVGAAITLSLLLFLVWNGILLTWQELHYYHIGMIALAFFSGVYIFLAGIFRFFAKPRATRATLLCSKCYSTNFLFGLLFGAVNPLNIAFILGSIPSIFLAEQLSGFDTLCISAVFFVSILVSNATYVLFADLLQSIFNAQAVVSMATAIGNVLFMIIGLYFIVSSMVTLHQLRL